MSDPMTNVEIEDVLSSIRRLVSDGDKARTRDPAPVQPHVPADAGVESHKQSGGEKSEKLLLTPAFLVVDSVDPARAPDDDVWVEDVPEDMAADQKTVTDDWDDKAAMGTSHSPAQGEHDDGDEQDAPLSLTDMIWESEAETADGAEARIPDRADLAATIAELEASISTDDSEYEPDGSEVPVGTIAWPGPSTRRFEDAEDAQLEDSTQDADAAGDEIGEAPELTIDDALSDSDMQTADAYADDDLDDLLDVGGLEIDEAALRAMIGQVVREELTGPLGERITRNVRKLVRREIYRILSSQEFD